MKNFKELRSQLNEDEHTATGKANRSAYTNDVIANLAGERSLNNLNAMLATIARSTFLDPIDAYNKIRVRLNIALLDFTWREVQGKTEVGQYTIPVFVRGVEGSLFLNVNVSLNADSLYVVDARLQTAADIENETLPAIEEEVEVLHLEQSNSARDRQNRDTEAGRKLWSASHTRTELKTIEKKFPLSKEHKNRIFRKKARDVRALVRTNTTPEERAAAHTKRRGVATGRIYKEEVEQIDETSEASKQAKAKAEGHMIRLYGKGRITYSSHSGGHFIEHESTDGSMTGETHGHTFHPTTGKISKTPHVTSSYYESTTNEEVEQIDELSPALLGRYIKKATYSASDLAHQAGRGMPNYSLRGAEWGSQRWNDLYKKVIKRERESGRQ